MTESVVVLLLEYRNNQPVKEIFPKKSSFSSILLPLDPLVTKKAP